MDTFHKSEKMHLMTQQQTPKLMLKHSTHMELHGLRN